MPGSLDVHLNRDGPHSIEVDNPSFEADDDFDIVLRNHGKALHVYLNLDDDLATVAELGTANHYVDEASVRRIRVHVSDLARPVRGRMKVVTGYGSETEYIDLSIVSQGSTERRVRVDEQLGQPQPKQDESVVDPEQLPVIALAVVALLVAVLAAAVIADPVVLVGVLVVILGVAIAGAILWGDYALE